jgi:hypothetical protein
MLRHGLPAADGFAHRAHHLPINSIHNEADELA